MSLIVTQITAHGVVHVVDSNITRTDVDPVTGKEVDSFCREDSKGRIDAAEYDRRRADSRGELDRVQAELARLAAAEDDFLTEGSLLLDLASRAYELYAAQPASEKRRLVNLVLSNCVWKDGVLTADYREPFGLLAVAATGGEGCSLAEGASGAGRRGWYP